jgi:hypothetical protein
VAVGGADRGGLADAMRRFGLQRPLGIANEMLPQPGMLPQRRMKLMKSRTAAFRIGHGYRGLQPIIAAGWGLPSLPPFRPRVGSGPNEGTADDRASAAPKMKVTRVDSNAAREDCDHDPHDPEEENFKLARRRHRSVLADHSIQQKGKPSVRKTTVAGVARLGCAT